MTGRMPAPGAVAGLDDQKALVKRARRDGLHWTFRAAMLALISGLSLRNGWLLFGVLFGLLSLMALQVARTTRRRARELAAKIKLLEPEG
jgi:hypothetical protein